ncbi:cyclohexanecarboxylate-CoA ligase [Nonomuraea solani]|uniref:Cyclohexanecarboxylate-CoA ligase n=1 Tax=Nonomuraea solani TaxID=1144553 RepID=A0A1H6F0J2_9ACTN|nr:AMP-binding protein [Nonomuraea solani]SEH02891.1 cyclohexanecarboxylate-CoA ligase [Nonomuraea solani]
MSLVTQWSSQLPATHFEQGWWRRETFLDDLRALVRDAPDSLAYLQAGSADEEAQAITFGKLSDACERLAAALWARGVRPGDVVAYQLPDTWESVALWLACSRIGVVVTSLRITAGLRERDLIVEGTGATLFIFSNVLADDVSARSVPVVALNDLLRQAESLGPLAPSDPAALGPDDICQILFTSGTTGRIKAVTHTYNTLFAGLRPVIKLLPADGPNACLAPLSGTYGLAFNVLAPLVAGRSTMLLPVSDAEACLDLIERHRVRCVSSNPTYLNPLLKAQRRRRRDLSALGAIVTAGAAIPAPIATGVRAEMCPVLVNVFGMTEGGVLCATSPSDPADRAEDGIGRPFAGVDVELRDQRPNGAGRLHVRGPSMCCAMVDLRTGETLWDSSTDEGWYDSGDVVQQDQQGRLRFLSRVADRIGWGHLIPISEVEGELLNHPAVADIALVGVPDPDGLEAACAVIVPDGAPPSLEELHAYLRARGMTEGYLPVRLAIVSALPQTSTGKVAKSALREQVISGGLSADSLS